MKHLHGFLLILVLISCLLTFTSCSSVMKGIGRILSTFSGENLTTDTGTDQPADTDSIDETASASANTAETDSSAETDTGKESDGSAAQADSEDQDQSKITQDPKEITVDEQVLLDQDGIKVTLTGFQPEDIFGPSLEILVENNTDRAVIVQTFESSVNGVMINTTLYCELEDGEKKNDVIKVMESDLELAKIEIIKDIELKFNVFDPETWDIFFSSDTVKITTTADPLFVQEYDDSGILALEDSGIKIVFQKAVLDESLLGADIFVYAENNREEDVTLAEKDVSINGIAVDSLLACEIVAGKKAYDKITIFLSEENKITSIDEIQLWFHIYNTDTWETILDSDVITVRFDS